MTEHVSLLLRVGGISGQAVLFWLLFIVLLRYRLAPLAYAMLLRTVLWVAVMISVVAKDVSVNHIAGFTWGDTEHQLVLSVTSNLFWIAGLFALWLTVRKRQP